MSNRESAGTRLKWIAIIISSMVLGAMMMANIFFFNAGNGPIGVGWPIFIGYLVFGALIIYASLTDIFTLTVSDSVFGLMILTAFIANMLYSGNQEYLNELAVSYRIHPLFGFSTVIAALASFLVCIGLMKRKNGQAHEEVQPEEAFTSTIIPNLALPKTALILICGLLFAAIAFLLGMHFIEKDTYVAGNILVFIVVFVLMTKVIGSHGEAALETIEGESASTLKLTRIHALCLGYIAVITMAMAIIAIRYPVFLKNFQDIVEWHPAGSMVRPLHGALVCLTGLMTGWALGWIIRIGGTLMFRKEAFGIADIYYMAAIGAMFGWLQAMVIIFISVIPMFLMMGLLKALNRDKKVDTVVPLIPGLALATFISVPFEYWVLSNLGFR